MIHIGLLKYQLYTPQIYRYHCTFSFRRNRKKTNYWKPINLPNTYNYIHVYIYLCKIYMSCIYLYILLQTNQEEKVKFNWLYCYDFVTPCAPLVLILCKRLKKENLSGYILVIHNIFVLLSSSLIRGVMIKKNT